MLAFWIKLYLLSMKIIFSLIRFCHCTLKSRITYHPQFRDTTIVIVDVKLDISGEKSTYFFKM